MTEEIICASAYACDDCHRYWTDDQVWEECRWCGSDHICRVSIKPLGLIPRNQELTLSPISGSSEADEPLTMSMFATKEHLLEAKLSQAQERIRELEAKLERYEKALEWYYDHWGTNDEDLKLKGYKVSKEALAGKKE